MTGLFVGSFGSRPHRHDAVVATHDKPRQEGLAVQHARGHPVGTDQSSHILTATQVFLDKYLHGEGRFPPAVIAASMCRKQE